MSVFNPMLENAKHAVSARAHLLRGRSERLWLVKLMLLAWAVRLAVVLVFNATGAIRSLGLSSDSFYYDRIGKIIAEKLRYGMAVTSPPWIDDGWFRFTGLIYYWLGDSSFWIQLINITLSTLTVLFAYIMAFKAYRDRNIARLTAVFVAFFPSFIYWSCMMLKDPAGLAAITMITAALVSLRQRVQPQWILFLAVGLLIYLGIRQYLFLVILLLIPVALVLFSSHRLTSSLGSLALALGAVSVITHQLGYGFLGLEEIGKSHYFDVEYINSTRVNIGDHGSGAIFENPEDVLWGRGAWENLKAAGIAVYFFFVSLDLTEIRSLRQIMALPEVLLFLSVVPALFRGTWLTFKQYRSTAWPLLVFGFAVVAVYGSATTNLGALFRWRMQALPMFLSMIALGIVTVRRGWIWDLGKRFGVVR